MTPERMAVLVSRWVRLYTRSLPDHDARRRIAEIDADLHDQIAHERAQGVPDRRIARSIGTRMVRGMAADASWRRERNQRRPSPEDPMSTSPTRRSAVRIAVVTAIVLLVPLLTMLVSDEADWGVFDFVLAGLLVAGAGVLLEIAVRSRGTAAYVAAVVAAVLGAAAVAAGEADDAPGLVLFGGLLLLGTFALTLRAAAGRSG